MEVGGRRERSDRYEAMRENGRKGAKHVDETTDVGCVSVYWAHGEAHEDEDDVIIRGLFLFG